MVASLICFLANRWTECAGAWMAEEGWESTDVGAIMEEEKRARHPLWGRSMVTGGREEKAGSGKWVSLIS